MYINTEHSIGDVVYVYSRDEDAIFRAKIASILVRAEKNGQQSVLYAVDRWQARNSRVMLTFTEDDLHRSVHRAFPEPTPEATYSSEAQEVTA